MPDPGAAVIAAVLFLAPAQRTGAAPLSVRTNIDLLSVAADSAAAAFMRRAGLAGGDTLRLTTRGDEADDRGQYVLSRWMLGLDRRNVRVVRSQDPVRAWFVFVSAAGVRYSGAEGRGFLRSGSVRRTAVVSLTWRRQAADGTVRADTLASACGDVIPRSALESAEQGGLLIGRPERPSPGLRFRILETAAAAAAVGWSVYAFFSIRSR
ncbi:hypothetical protein JW777_02115 [bacterium]|nr:hypothetical protein [bacterium]